LFPESQAFFHVKTFALAVSFAYYAIPSGTFYVARYFSFFKSELKFYPFRKDFPNYPN
jgi:hypothetical protein